jgi:hypothetical protein
MKNFHARFIKKVATFGVVIMLATLFLAPIINAATYNYTAGAGYPFGTGVALSSTQLGAGTVNLTGDSTLNVSANLNVLYDNSITGGSSVTKTGAGTLSLYQHSGVGLGNGGNGYLISGTGGGGGGGGIGAGGGGAKGATGAGYSGGGGGGGAIYIEFYDANGGITGQNVFTSGTGSVAVPPSTTTSRMWAVGAGGGGAGVGIGNISNGGGGGGGTAFANVSMTGVTSISYTVGGGGAGSFGNAAAGGNTIITAGTVNLTGNGGGGGISNGAGGTGGAFSVTGTTLSSGGIKGGNGTSGTTGWGGGGGGAAGNPAPTNTNTGSTVNYATLNSLQPIATRGTASTTSPRTWNINAGEVRTMQDNTFYFGSTINFADVAGAKLVTSGFDTEIFALSGGGTTGGVVDLHTNSTLRFTGKFAGTYTFGGVISGGGSLIFNPTVKTFVQIFTGDNTFTGTTTLQRSTLSVRGKYASPISMSGGTLSGAMDSSASLTMTGGTLVPGSTGAGNVGTMKVSSATLAGTMTLNTTASAISKLESAGAVALGGVTINIPSALAAGTYDIITSTSMTGTATLGTNTTGHAAYIVQDGNTLKLVIEPQIVFTGVTLATTEGGANGSASVKLSAKPLGNVTVQVASADTGAMTVSPSTFTFTTANWNTAQTVNLTAVQDVDPANESVTLTASIVTASTSAEYDAVPNQTLTATVTDDEVAGVTVSATAVTVGENAGTGTFTVKLSAQPLSNVVLNVASAAVGEATVSPTTLTFTSANWNTAQTVTVTGVDDFIDRNDSTSITVSVNDASSYDPWDTVADKSVAVTLTDNDTVGITLSKTTASATEQGATDTFTVKLNTQPLSNVVVSLTSSDTGAATASPATLTFTSANWNTAQTVTLTGVDDADIVNESVTITAAIVDASSEDTYDTVADKTVALTVVDNDTAGFALSTTALTIGENAGTGTYTIVLNAQPSSNVEIAVSSGATGEATVSPATLTFTTANWNVAQTVTVTGVDDLIDQVTNDTAVITASVVDANSDNAWDPLANKTLTVTLTDDDSSSLIISATTLTVAENAGTGTFTVKLSSQPLTNVVLGVSSSLVGEGTVAPTTLTFTSANWNTTQTVTVTGVNDNIDTPTNSTSNIVITVVDASSYNTYDPITDQTVVATFTDDDTAGITVSSTTVTAGENAGTGTFTVRLNTQPQSNVVLGVSSSATAEGTVAPATLTFTNLNWNTPQTVTVTGVNDSIDKVVNDTSDIVITVVDASSDNQYDPLTDQTVVATFTDDDVAGFTVTPTTLTVAENAGTGTFTVKLNTQPTPDVVVSLTSSAVTQGTVSPATLTFTSANWNTTQTVTVTGVNDLIDTAANDTANIVVAIVDASSDDQYDPLTDKTVVVTFTDDDTASYTVSATTLTVGENAGTGTFTVKLDTQPVSDVVISLTSSALTQGTVSPATLTFTSVNWNTTQTVTVTGVNDQTDTLANDTANIVVAIVDASSDNQFDALADKTVAVTFTDDDTASFILSSTTVTAAENGGTGTFTVRLGTQPLSNVVISLTSTTLTQGTVAPATLTFTTANWNTAQTVTVTGVDDLIDTAANDTSNIVVAVVDATSDNQFDPLADQTVVATYTDNDTASYTVSATTVTAGENAGTATFTVKLDTQPVSNVVISTTSGALTQGTVAPATLTFTPANWNTAQTVTVTGVNDQTDTAANDTAIITMSIVDATSDDQFDPLADKTVTATFTDDDTAGFTVTPTTLTVAENAGTGTFTVKLNTQPTSDVVVSLTSSAITQGTVSPATLTFTSANWNTTQTVTVTGVNDLIDTAANDTANIVVAIVDASSDNQFDPLTDQTVVVTFTDDDTASYTVSATTLTVGENAGTGTFTVKLDTQPVSDVVISLTSSALTQGTVSPATLTFTSVNWNTTQTVTVTGVNDQTDTLANDTANIVVAIVDASSDNQFDALADKTVAVTFTDDDTASFILSSTTVTAAENGGTGTFTVRLGTQPLSNVVISLTSVTTTEGTVAPATLTFTTANWNTAQTVTVTGVDDLIDTAANDTSNIVVAVVDATSDNQFDPLADQTVVATYTDNDTASYTVSATTITVGENAGTATFTVKLDTQPVSNVVISTTSGSLTEGTVAPATLTFTPANWNTAQTVTVTGVNDQADTIANDTAVITMSIVDATSDNQFDPLADKTVTATFTDDDTANVIVSATTLTVGENAGTGTFTVKLATQPLTDVVVSLTSSALTQGTVAPATLTFTSANWNTTQTVTVTGVNDAVDTATDDTGNIVVAVVDASSYDTYDAVTDKTVAVTYTDDDQAGITLSSTSVTVGENAGTGTFTVKLNTAPTSNVVLSVTSSDTAQGTVAPINLTFTPANWNTAQTVTVTGVNDPADTIANDTANITIAVVDASSDNTYDPVADAIVAATFTDDDTANVVVSATTLTVAENAGTGTFTVVLSTQPLTNVVVNVTSLDVAQGTLVPATLTFTSANWNVAQTVTVTGVNDNVDTPTNDTSNISISVVDASSYDTFDSVTDKTVVVTYTDDDTAGTTVSLTTLTVGENAGTGTFTVKLNTQPQSDVVVSLTSSAVGEATVAPATLTFTSANWNTVQTVTVTGVNDPADTIANDVANIVIAIVDASSDNQYDPLVDKTVAVTLTDDDTADFTVTPGTLTVAENAGTGTFTVVLTTQPLTNVVLNVASSSVVDGTVAPATLTFTSANWNTPQTVTVTGVNDTTDSVADDTANMVVSVVDASSYDTFDAIADKAVAVTFTDDDQAGITISQTTLTVGENAGTGTFTVKLNTAPLTNVVVNLTSSAATEATAAPATLTFTPANWNTPQTVTVTGVNDPADTIANDTATITVSVNDATSDDKYDPVADQTVAITLTDDDTANVIVSATTLTVAENAGTGTFTVVLSTQPLTNVVVNVTSLDVAQGTLVPATLTFTSANWNVAQTVTVTGVNDNVDTPTNDTSNISISVVDASSYDTFDSVTDKTVAVTYTDDDTASYTVSLTTLTVGENAGTGTFTVVLTTQPISNVVISVTSSSLTEGTAAPANLTFTSADWNVPQTVTVTGVDDPADTIANDTANVVMSVVDASSDNQFDPLADKTVVVTYTDDDTASLVVTPSSTAIAENGGTGIYKIHLGAQPMSDVVVNVTSSSVADGTVSPASVTFTSANWNVDQDVTVTAVDDLIDQVADDSANITFAVNAATSYDTFDTIPAETRIVTFTDNDQAGITISQTTLTVGENAGTGTFTVKLNTAPLTNVVVNLTSSAATEATAAPATLTFTPANWNTPQTVTVTGVNDPADTVADDTATITVSVNDATSDDKYDPITDQTVAITLTDDDTANVIVTPTTLTVGENGGTGTINVKLATQPMTDVILNVVSGDIIEGTVSVTSLTFTSANWNTDQVVTVTGVNDAVDTVADDTVDVTISVADATSYDTFDAVTDKVVAVTFTDDDIAGYTVSATTLTVAENNGTGTFTVVLNTQPTSDVVISVVSGAVGDILVAPPSLTFSPTNWNTAQIVTATGVNDNIDTPVNDSAILTLSIVDASSDNRYDPLADKTVTVVATDDDLADVLVSTNTLNVGENAGTNSFTVKLATQPLGDVVLNVTSSALTEGTAAPTTLTFTTVNWNLDQSVTVNGIDDFINTATNSTSNILVSVVDASSDNQYDPVTDKTVVATFIDDDQPGFAFNIVDNVTGEDGNTGSFKVKLNSQPTADVILPLSSSNVGEGTIAITSLTFTTANWNVEQTVTVTGINDPIPVADGSVPYDIVTGDVTSADLQYDALTAVGVQDVNMLNENDDAPGVRVTLTGFTTEAGGTATVSIVLLSMPTANVIIPLTVSDATEGSITVASITITPANWNNAVANTVTVTGVDDFVVDGNIVYTLNSGDPSSTDPNYDTIGAVDVTDVSITNNDNDVAGVTITQSPVTVSVTEGGAPAFYSVFLTSQPTADVTITLNNGAQITASPSTLTFTPTNWKQPQEVSVLAVNDLLVEVTATDSITHVASSLDTMYQGIAVATKAVTIIDDDAAGFNISKVSTTIAENAGTDTFTVVLTAQPLTDVKLLVASDDITNATSSPSTLTFTNANWNIPQTVTITAVDDLVDTATDDLALIKVNVDTANSNDLFDSAPEKSVAVILTDDDIAGFAVTPGSLLLAEAGGTGTFTVVLKTKPTSNVVIGLISSSLDDATVDLNSVTFTPANWNVPQTVTVSAVDDFVDTATNDLTTVVAQVLDTSSDDQYDDLADISVTVNITDNDTAAYTVSATTLTVDENGGTGVFTVKT